MTKDNPIRPTDDTARDLARGLLATARFAALGVIDPDGAPLVTRVGFGLGPSGEALTLVSGLSAHTQALNRHAVCSVLVGEPGAKGDALSHPRLSLQAKARFIPREKPRHDRLAAHWLAQHPKARVYLSLPDFRFVQFIARRGLLNGGFGRAFVLTPTDMGLSA